MPKRVFWLLVTAVLPTSLLLTIATLPSLAVSSTVLIDGRVLGKDVHLGEGVTLGDLEVSEIVRGRDLDRTGTELGVDGIFTNYPERVLKHKNDRSAIGWI